MEHPDADPLRTRFPHVLVTGAAGQLGTALLEAFPWADARTRHQMNVLIPALVTTQHQPDLVLHCAAWTAVDHAQDPGVPWQVNVRGTERVVRLGAPVVYYSTDYVFDGTKREPYVESDKPNPINEYGRTKLEGERRISEGWIVRASWLFGWTGRNFVRTMLSLGAERDEVRVVDDQRGCPTFVGHLADATRAIVELPFGVYHVAASGDCTWADFAEAIFEEASLSCRVVRTSTAELGRPAPRPAYSVLRSEHPGTPTLPHWRAGLRECLARLSAEPG
jgi:dTDP-4-dehydrorhamnose reductase